MQQKLYAVMSYGPIKQGQEYVLLSEGYDFFKVRCQGKVVHAFKFVFGSKPALRMAELESYDDVLAGVWS